METGRRGLEDSENNLENNGVLLITAEERLFLDSQRSGRFEKHPVLDNVEIKQIDIKSVPSDILAKIAGVNGKVTSFMAIKIKNGVPLHQHKQDGEIYFGNSNVSVLLLDSSKREIGIFSLSDDKFTAVNVGESHSATNHSDKDAVFFGVKFKNRI